MSQEALARGEACEREKAAMVVDEYEQRGLVGLVRKPAMWRSVVLPELPDLLDLPAAHRCGTFFVKGIGGQLLKERPATDGGAIEPEVMTAMHLRSGETVGGRGAGTQQLAQQIEHQRGPLRETVAAGTPRLPVALRALGARAQIVGVEHVEAAATEA